MVDVPGLKIAARDFAHSLALHGYSGELRLVVRGLGDPLDGGKTVEVKWIAPGPERDMMDEANEMNGRVG